MRGNLPQLLSLVLLKRESQNESAVLTRTIDTRRKLRVFPHGYQTCPVTREIHALMRTETL